ncbi:hypothetical protein BS47DRAFT_263959 [Hydnum rufescens UP504]|uniref:Uncharacterized protein n=1 Tax=Hydnum rufescens UP504 TaxID=1448309 RepID=A0A9P6ALA0_9AGAM|nr:hypothetical protein BS47DRAFT_263959 [Hydnum rufescens UP504]
MSERPIRPVQKDSSGGSPFTGPNGLHQPYNEAHYSFHGTYDASSTKQPGEIEGIPPEVRQSTCNRHCNGNPVDIVDPQTGLLNHFDEGDTYVRGHIVCKTKNACAFRCDCDQTYSNGMWIRSLARAT